MSGFHVVPQRPSWQVSGWQVIAEACRGWVNIATAQQDVRLSPKRGGL